MKQMYVMKRLIRRQIPAPVFFGIMTASGRTAKAEDRPDEVLESMVDRLRHLPIGLEGKHVLDLGGGRYARIAVRLLKANASHVTLADHYARPLTDLRHRKILDEDCLRLGLESAETMQSISIIVGEFLDSSPSDPAARADLIISDSTMEHVSDPAAILKKCWEWLRPGGFVSHRIDLRDHLFDTPFEMLTYSDRTWCRWLNPKRGFHLNRRRLPDYLDALHEAKFDDVSYQVLQKDEGGLREIWPRLDDRFREMDPDLLAVTVVHLSARKPH